MRCANQRLAGIYAFACRLYTHHSTNPLIHQLKHWLVKSEPDKYSWATFVQEDGTAWTGVRNYQARNNLNLMQPGDLVLFYHSVSEKAVVGVAEVAAWLPPMPPPKPARPGWPCS